MVAILKMLPVIYNVALNSKHFINGISGIPYNKPLRQIGSVPILQTRTEGSFQVTSTMQ